MRMLLYVLPLLTILFGASVVYVLLLLMTSFVLLLYVLLVLTFWFPHRQRQLLFLLLFFLWFSMQAFLVLKSRHTVDGTVQREIQYCHKIVVTFCIGYGYCLNIVNVDITSSFLLSLMCFSVPVVLKLRCDRRFPRNFSWDWINSFESCKGSSIPKRNKELSSLKKRGNTGNIGEFPGNSPGIQN